MVIRCKDLVDWSSETLWLLWVRCYWLQNPHIYQSVIPFPV